MELYLNKEKTCWKKVLGSNETIVGQVKCHTGLRAVIFHSGDLLVGSFHLLVWTLLHISFISMLC